MTDWLTQDEGELGYCPEHDCDLIKCPEDCHARIEYERYRDPVEMDVPLGERLEVSAARAYALVQETGRTVHFMFIYNAWAFPGDTVRDIILRRNPYYTGIEAQS